MSSLITARALYVLQEPQRWRTPAQSVPITAMSKRGPKSERRAKKEEAKSKARFLRLDLGTLLHYGYCCLRACIILQRAY